MYESIEDIMSEAPGEIEPVQPIPPGFGVVDTLHTAADAGMVAHRGVLHPDEYVDAFLLRDVACDALGFTYDEITSVYRQGPKSPEQRQLRARIDARVLALSREGGNITQLADALGVAQSALDRAVKRAKAVDVQPQVRQPAVITSRVCFKCGEDGARPRRRRFSASPEHLRGTIDLCDPCEARGHDHRQGNPAYWEFMDRRMPVGMGR